MSRITVLGGTGYAGSAIAAEAAARGHQVTSLSRSLPPKPIPDVTYVQGDVADEAALAPVIEGADVVVSALAPRGPLAEPFREVSRTVARLAAAAGARLYVVGGFSSLRPAPGADRFVSDLSGVPAELHPEITQGAAVVIEDLPPRPRSSTGSSSARRRPSEPTSPASGSAATGSATRWPCSPTAARSRVRTTPSDSWI